MWRFSTNRRVWNLQLLLRQTNKDQKLFSFLPHSFLPCFRPATPRRFQRPLFLFLRSFVLRRVRRHRRPRRGLPHFIHSAVRRGHGSNARRVGMAGCAQSTGDFEVFVVKSHCVSLGRRGGAHTGPMMSETIHEKLNAQGIKAWPGGAVLRAWVGDLFAGENGWTRCFVAVLGLTCTLKCEFEGEYFDCTVGLIVGMGRSQEMHL